MKDEMEEVYTLIGEARQMGRR